MRSKSLLLYITIQILLFAAIKADISTSSLSSSIGAKITNLVSSYQNGPSLKPIGDINNDGYQDFAVGMPDYSSDKGKVTIVFGTGSGFSSFDITTLSSSQGFTITGVYGSDYFGYSVTGLGDVNGDGIDDFAIGAYKARLSYNGAVYVIFGKSTSYSYSGYSIDTFLSYNYGFMITISSPTYSYFGFSVAAAGDVDGDGKKDILIGAPEYTGSYTDQGRAYVIYGKAGSTRTDVYVGSMLSTDGFYITGPSSSYGYFGYSVSGAGDMNGDGRADVIIGAPGADKVYVVYGVNTYPYSISASTVTTSTGFIITSSSYNSIGYVVAGNGDVNGDGKKDLIISNCSASYYDCTAYVIFGTGASNLGTITVESVTLGRVLQLSTYSWYSALGYALSINGDVNGDGVDDILISAPGMYNTYGTVYVIYGKSSISNIQYLQPDKMSSSNGFAITSSTANSGLYSYNYFGSSVSASADFNSAGPKDILIGESVYGSTGNGFIIYGTTQTAGTYTASSSNTGSSPSRGTKPVTTISSGGNGSGGSGSGGGSYSYSSRSSKTVPVSIIAPVVVGVVGIILVITLVIVKNKQKRLRLMRIRQMQMANQANQANNPSYFSSSPSPPVNNDFNSYNNNQGIAVVQVPQYNSSPVYVQPQQNYGQNSFQQYGANPYGQPQPVYSDYNNYNNYGSPNSTLNSPNTYSQGPIIQEVSLNNNPQYY